ncbi:MarR family winged helix-turn-helix transcriptional regulator [Streptomyces sp. NPDC054863]
MGFTDSELLSQSMGYWAGAAQQAIVAYMNDSLGQLGLRQPHAWALYRVSEDDGGLSRGETARRIVETRPYVDISVLDAAIDELIGWNWLAEDAEGRLTPTASGADRWAKVRDEVVPAAQARLRDGVGDEEYVAAVKVLRKMIGNAGGDVGFAA